MSTPSISNIYDHLSNDGFRPSIDDDGDLRFKVEGRVYFVRFDEEDPTFVRLCAINVATSLELSFQQALEYANQVSAEIKVAKAFCIERDGKPIIWVTAECRYASSVEFVAQLDKLISGIRVAVDQFYEIHKERKQAQGDDADSKSIIALH